MRRQAGWMGTAACWLALVGFAHADELIPADLVLRGGTLVDGTGAPGRRADVAIRGDRIVAVGSFEADPAARVIDATGLVVAPGFIDLHSHSDEPFQDPKLRANRNYLAQGVTTVVTGNCGSGPVDVAAYFRKIESEVGTNVIHLVPHGSLRRQVMGMADRKADGAALAAMREKVELGMRDGAWGLSTGLIYLPGRYADTAELIDLARVVARHGGLYASHIRDEGDGLLASIDEALAIGRGAGVPVHVSHLKATGRANWGQVVPACDRIVSARASGLTVTADQYPYTASSTSLAAMVIPHWARQDGAAGFARIAADPGQGARLRREIEAELAGRDGGQSIRIARYPKVPSRVGRDLAAIAAAEGISTVDLIINIETNGGAQAISFGMGEDDVRHVMARDFVATASDGSSHAPGGGDRPHPRAYGTFPRKIRYALDEKVISLEQAIRSCSGLPAAVLGLVERGVVRPGAFADVVVFDPATFRDAATYDDPTRYATGVRHLLVNGVPAIADGTFTKEVAGRVLRRTEDGPADLIVRAGRIWTGDADRPWAQAVAARGGKIVAVGSIEDVFLPFRGPKSRVLDRPDAFAVPGLIDAHGHLSSLGSTVDQIDLRGVRSPEEVARMVKAWIDARPGDGWVLGRNWDQSLWPGGEFSTADVLDRVAPNRPVWLTRVDGHASWANSEALRRAKVTADAKAPPGGQIIRDKEGRPTGVFLDAAKELVSRSIPRPTKAEAVRHLLAAQDQALRVGLTGVHDAGVGRVDQEAFRDLDRDQRLKLRVYGMASPPDDREVEFVSTPPRQPRPGERFEMRAVKLFVDGAMGSRGAWLFESYADDPGNTGLVLTDPDHIEKITEAALRHGWQVCTHAIGDRGNAAVLDAYIAAMAAVPEANDPRLRVEHAQVVRESDVPRFARHGIIASMQPSHASTDKRWADARLGPDSRRVQGAYAWRWFLDAKARVAFGSDFPVEVPSPFWGLYAALTRQDEAGEPPGGWHPDQRMTMEEALRGFTAGAAYAAFAEDHVGVLRPGMLADMTVVDRDLFRVAPAEVLKARVMATIVAGEVVYEPAAR